MSYKSDRPSFQERLAHFVNVLRTDIINGIRQQGSYLPSESSLAKQFELSNKSIRKGLDQLVGEGLIVKIDRVGSMVTTRARESITLNFGCAYTLGTDFQMEELIAEFSRRNPGIHIRRISLNSSSYVQSAEEMIRNGLIDVVSFNSPQFQEWTEGGLAPLLEPVDTDSKLYSIAQEAFHYEGEQYAKPVSFSPVVLCYNKQHFMDADIHEPDSYWTWDDLIAAAEIMSRARGRHGMYFLPTSENRYSIFLLQALASRLGTLPGQDDALYRMKAGLKKLNDLIGNRDIFPNYWAHGNDETIQLFAEGQVSIILCTYFNLNELAHLSIDYDICPLPSLRRGDSQKTLLLSIGTAIVQHSKHKEAGRRFVDFLVSEDAQNIIRDKTVSIPARKESAAKMLNNDVRRPTRYTMFREMLPSFAYHGELGIRMKDLKLFTKWLKEYWSGMIDESALDEKLADLLSSKESKMQ